VAPLNLRKQYNVLSDSRHQQYEFADDPGRSLLLRAQGQQHYMAGGAITAIAGPAERPPGSLSRIRGAEPGPSERGQGLPAAPVAGPMAARQPSTQSAGAAPLRPTFLRFVVTNQSERGAAILKLHESSMG